MSSTKIHQTAIIEQGAELGVEVEVGPYAVIGSHVKLGDKTRIGPHVVIEGRTTLGPECQVFQFASLGAPPQDLKFGGEPSTLEIGAGNVFREYVTLSPGTKSGHMRTVVGDKNLFMANSHVGHDCNIGSNNIFANSAGLAGHVTICSNVILGGLVGIHQFCRIGSYAFLSAGSMIGGDIPPYCIGQGDRCHLRGLNLIGLQRAGFSKEDISEIKRAYRHLFTKVGQLKRKVETLPEELAQRPLIQAMLEFLEGTERGICTPTRGSSE